MKDCTKLRLAALAAAVLCAVASPSFAEGGGCKGDCGHETKPDPKPELPKPTNRPQPEKGNPYEPHEAQHWTGVCEYLPDGRILVHTAFLRDPQTAARQCRERLEARDE